MALALLANIKIGWLARKNSLANFDPPSLIKNDIMTLKPDKLSDRC
jgi:hypothetical protein